MNKAVQAYRNHSATTATPAELTLMLYSGAIKFIRQARMAIQNKNFEQANASLIRAQDIIQELIITLNMDVEISQQFLVMYEYMHHRLVEANIKKDVSILDEQEDLFVQFRDTWKQAMVLAKSPVKQVGQV